MGLKKVALAAAFWTAVALVFCLPLLSQQQDWRKVILSSLAQWWGWGLLTPVILSISERVRRRPWLHLPAGLIVSLVYAYLMAFLAALDGAGTWSQVVDLKTLGWAWRELFWSLVTYGLIVGLSEAYRYQLRNERLERSFAEARLNGLRMQLNPHFLFNALNTISAQLEREPRQARQMIEHLGDLLRLSLASHSQPQVALQEELTFLDPYLAIQKIRFGPSLRVEMNIAPQVQRALVPSLFLQPLVENAIRHGLAPRAGGGTVVINARSIGDQLHISVLDDGVGLPASWQPGVGLSVTRERIQGFSMQSRPGGGTTVELQLPCVYSL